MNFLNLLPEVIESGVLPYLGWNDLLHLRLVCKTTLTIVNDYFKVCSDVAPEIEISTLRCNAPNLALETYVKLGFPSIKIFLRNENILFYDQKNVEVATFLNKYGRLIKHLRVEKLSLYCGEAEKTFYEGFVNLETLDAKQVTLWSERAMSRANEIAPHVLEKLRSLRFDSSINPNEFPNIIVALDACLENCKMLKCIWIPSIPRNAETTQNVFRIFDMLRKTVERKGVPSNSNGCQTKPEAIDFTDVGHIQDLSIRTDFLNLCYVCAANGVMLHNVRTEWAPGIRHYYHLNQKLPVVSTIGAWFMDMPYLEKIEINSVEQCFEILMNMKSGKEKRPIWPKLNCLSIDIFQWSRMMIRGIDISMENLLRFFFEGICRETLKELCVVFPAKSSVKVSNQMVDNMLTSCPHLKMLSLENWPASDEAFHRLRNGFLELEFCKRTEWGKSPQTWSPQKSNNSNAD